MLGKRIFEMRQKLGWSQSRVAKELNVNVKTIKNWEGEVSDPSVKNIIQLAQLFSVTADFLLGIDDRITIVVPALPKTDQDYIRSMCQLYITHIQNRDSQ